MNIVSKSNYRVSQGAKQFIVVVGVMQALAGRKKAVVGKPAR